MSIRLLTVAALGLMTPVAQAQSSVDRGRAPEMSFHVDADGTVHVPGLTIPPSGYWSPQFKKAYVAGVSQVRNRSKEIPDARASESAWKKYYAACGVGTASYVAKLSERHAVDVSDTRLGGVHVSIIVPRKGIASANLHRVLINLHGGACRGTAPGQVESIAIAASGRFKVITVDYRPAPRNTYSQSLEDVTAVYEALLAQYKSEAIGIFGSSLGGLLAAQSVSNLQAKGLARPGAVGIFWAGLPALPLPFGGWGDSMMWGSEAVLQSDPSPYLQMVATTVGPWFEGAAQGDPIAFPGSSETVLAQFPATLFLSGTRAHDMSAAITSHVRLLKLGVDASVYIMEGAGHGASLLDDVPEAEEANTYIARWFAMHLR